MISKEITLEEILELDRIGEMMRLTRLHGEAKAEEIMLDRDLGTLVYEMDEGATR